MFCRSFEGVCTRLGNALESLRGLVVLNCGPTKDTLIQHSFTAIQIVQSVFYSMNDNIKEQNKDAFLRLLFLVKSHNPPIFSADKIKEVEKMMLYVNSLDVSSNVRATDKEEKRDMDGMKKINSDNLAKSTSNIYSTGENLVNYKPNIAEALKPAGAGFRSKGALLPLLDLHKDHDVDSLPSPTRETEPSLPEKRMLSVGDGMDESGVVMDKVVPDTEDIKMRPYETDVLKAVSSYQQKFGHTSFFLKDRLPSPTPSEESRDGVDETGGEVSSSFASAKLKPANVPIMGQPIVSTLPGMESTSAQGLAMTRNAPLINSRTNPTVRGPARSRDPRLRVGNSDVPALDLNQHLPHALLNGPKMEAAGALLNTRKQKSFEEPFIDGPALKKQKNGLEGFGGNWDAQSASGTGGWLEEVDTVSTQTINQSNLIGNAESLLKKTDNGATCSGMPVTRPSSTLTGNEPVSTIASGNTVSVPVPLKDIVVNPMMLLNILKMQQQKLAAETLLDSADPGKTPMQTLGPNSIVGAVPSVNIALSNPTGILPKPAGTVQVPSQMAPADESGKIRMKPRDPRRILHGNTVQRSGNLGSEQSKTNGTIASGTEAETKIKQSHVVPPPDISRQFTKNLKNIADLISVPQAVNVPPVSQTLPSQPVQMKAGRETKVEVSSPDDQRMGTCLMPEVSGVHSQNTWGDFEHLFEGFDDQQKAAIHRERARRIEEQKKMFAARKLCLVLDLDHTLLNSAKFNEVDPVHDEILRKKEEQDREKPQRHLFRFPYMGMWTKLRPGIWNFLEKASKLYELHLYTMGNKLYATEMAKVLDPKGILFAGRVISRGDDGDPFDGDERVPKSKDLEGVLGMESAVVIIDDSVRVWPHNKLNLIVVERYTYFPCSRRQFGLPGPSLLEIDHDERPEDGTLASSLAVIERIHQIFFSHPSLDDVDVRNILAAEQRKILSGCRIVFSRVFPVGEANPHLHPLWQTAEQFGAVCTNQIDEHVTHVVANSLGTDKVNWALSTGRFVVNPGWVEASALLYRRANEQDFSIKP